MVGSAAPSQPIVSDGGRTLTWNLGTLNNGDPAVTITYDVKIDANASTEAQTNVAEICVSELPLCDTDDETVTPENPDIEIVKTAGNAEDGEVYTTEPGSVTFTYVVTNTGPLPLQNVTVTDDNGTPVTGDDFAATCPKTTLAVDESMTCTATILVSVDRTNVAVARGFTAEGNPVEDDDDAVVEILTHGLVIAKSNNAPIETLELPDGIHRRPPDGRRRLDSHLHPELHLQRRPGHQRGHHGRPAHRPDVRGGVRDQQHPVHLRGLQRDDADADLDGRDREGQRLAELPGDRRHRRRGARAAADQRRDHRLGSDPARRRHIRCLRPGHPEGETDVPSAPPTDTLEPAETSTGSSLPLILAVLGIILLAVAFVTPVPATAKRRTRR